MKTHHRILDFYATKSWAILEENLQEMFGIYQSALERKALDLEFDPEALAAKVGRPLDNSRRVSLRDGVAVIPISGPIFRYANLFTQISGATSIEVLATDFRQALDDRAVKAIVLDVNSPGGEVDGTSEFAQHVFNARGEKPIVAYVGHLGASAAYWIASAADEIVAADTAPLGSIGVVGTVYVHKDKNRLEFVSSQSPNKRPDPTTESGRSLFQSHVDALADVFIETVARNRNLSADDVISNGGAGGLKVGRHAVTAGLADRVGTLEGVISELASGTWKKNVSDEAMVNTLGEAIITEVIEITPPLIGGVETMPEKEKPAAEETPAQDAQQVAELQAKLSEAEAEAEEHRQAAETAQAEADIAKKEVQAAVERIAALEKNARQTRFSQLAKEWIGESDKHLSMLEFLATQAEAGEDSELFRAYVTQQNAIAEQVRSASLFVEVGSSAPAEGTASAAINAMVKQYREADPKMTEAQAFAKVWSEHPDLRMKYREEERRAVN